MSCTKCHSLSDGLMRSINRGLFPNQGENKLKHRCVFCGESLFKKDFYDKIITPGHSIGFDCNFCERAEEVTTRETGFWWWKSTETFTVNKGCSDTPHLHRKCWSCSASWLERTLTQENIFKTYEREWL
jgi:hypothetical protein